MGNVLLVYVIIQLLSTAYGLSVIEAVKPVVNKKLVDDGYVLKNKNSMYKFNEGLINFAKGLIPFYYTIKAINLVKGSDAVERAAAKEVQKGNYITLEEALNPKVEDEPVDTVATVTAEPVISFEKPEKYTARRIDLSLVESHEDEIEYDTINEVREEKLNITPFASELVKPVVKQNPVTLKDIINTIISLDPESLDNLREKIYELAEVKRGHKVLKLKDVA